MPLARNADHQIAVTAAVEVRNQATKPRTGHNPALGHKQPLQGDLGQKSALQPEGTTHGCFVNLQAKEQQSKALDRQLTCMRTKV
jgi:hypothetical protein